MKRSSLALLFILMLTLAAVLCACGGDEPEDTTAPATSAPATTTPAASAPTSAALTTEAPATSAPATSAPVTSAPATSAPATSAPATSAPATTAPVTTAVPNPITKVKVMDADHRKHPLALRLTYGNNAMQYIEPSLAIRVGYNSLTYDYALDEQTGILTMTLYEAATTNIANQHLGLSHPTVVRLRENAGWLEWARQDSDVWAQLCRTDDADTKILATLAAAVDVGKTPEEVTGDGVTLVIAGNKLRFRAHNWLKPGYDLVTDCDMRSEKISGTFMQVAIREISSTLAKDSMAGGTTFKDASDEIPAFYMNGTYIGAAHGTYCISAVPNPMLRGLTEADIGKVFTRPTDGQRYVLVKAFTDEVWFCPFNDEAMETGDFTIFCYPKKGFLYEGDVLSYDESKTFTVDATATQEQFRFAANGCVQHAYLNGTVEVDLAKNGVYTAEFVDFHETYNVLYLPAVLEYLMNNVGETDLDGNPINSNTSHYDEAIDEYYLTYNLTHRFHRNGSYTVYQTLTAKKDLSGARSFGVMSGPFANKNDDLGNHHYIYAPGSTNFGTPTLHTNTTVEAEGDPSIRSFYQLTTADGAKAMNVGYYPYFGVATDENRADAIAAFGDGVVGQWYSSRKMYPYLYKNNDMKAGTEVSFIGYHVPTVKIDDDFFAINWYFVGDEIYLSFHTDKAVEEKTVALPNSDYLTGLAVTVEEASDGFTVHSATVGADGIRVSTTGAGYCTVKLTKVN